MFNSLVASCWAQLTQQTHFEWYCVQTHLPHKKLCTASPDSLSPVEAPTLGLCASTCFRIERLFYGIHKLSGSRRQTRTTSLEVKQCCWMSARSHRCKRHTSQRPIPCINRYYTSHHAVGIYIPYPEQLVHHTESHFDLSLADWRALKFQYARKLRFLLVQREIYSSSSTVHSVMMRYSLYGSASSWCWDISRLR